MAKECEAEGCSNPRFGGGFCKWHQRLRTDKKQKRIAVFSKKREGVNMVYNQKARAFREANPMCRVNSPVCTRFTQGVHHVRGKATNELLLDETNWLPSCNRCNLWIEENHEAAVSLGLKKSRHHE